MDFGGSSPPKPQPAAPAPTLDDPSLKLAADQAAADAARLTKSRRGRAASILSAPSSRPPVGTRGVSLLGGGERTV